MRKHIFVFMSLLLTAGAVALRSSAPMKRRSDKIVPCTAEHC
jgi:hypothetical protein